MYHVHGYFARRGNRVVYVRGYTVGNKTRMYRFARLHNGTRSKVLGKYRSQLKHIADLEKAGAPEARIFAAKEVADELLYEAYKHLKRIPAWLPTASEPSQRRYGYK